MDELEKIKEKFEKESEEKKRKEKERKIEELKERYEVVKGIPEQIAEEVEEKPKKREEKVPEIILKVERLDAKVATLDDYRKVMDEKISRIAEEIGELRSSFLALDKRFSPLEINAERALKAVSEVMPEKIRADFQKIEKEILSVRAEIERINAVIASLKTEEKRLMEAFEKIKNVENVVEISKKIEEKLAKVEEAIRYADRVSAKTEVVFSELSEKLAEIERQKGKIGRLDELTKELVKTLDEISLKIPKFAEKVEVAKLSEEIAGKIKPIDPGNIKKEIAAEINSRFSSLKEEIEKRLEEFDRSIKSLEGIAEKVESISLQIGDLSRMPEILSRVEILSTEIGDLRKRLEEMSFEEIRTSLEQRFEELKAEYERKFEDLSRMPEILSRVESLIEESSNALMREEEKSKENFAKISQLIQEMTKIVETQSKKIEDFHKSLITYFKLFNCVNRLQVLTKAGEIESALADLRKNVDSLKELGVFDKEIENFLMSTLLDFSKVWSVYDKDIAELYENEASKYSEETYSLEAKEATQ